eukprot:CAMPEP_0198135224 /NCGR_PEP_ID=MMETSP1442-20131203/60481_1 /TAXON_ID= /ORGANISM="Craspedostauros australis, Strain CCMP3328" /LENGTH=349 /DNA_ID=CAMNT_0043796387 /DNA_START=52 /DNA_END=1101 /DNA_ORIENTATION=-
MHPTRFLTAFASTSSSSSSAAAAATAATSVPQIHNSISEIADLYDGFILDQFGVLHNGKVPLEGAPECIRSLKKMGKKLIILSNTSGTAVSALSKLPRYDMDPSDFVGAVTSGEESSSRYIRETYGNADGAADGAQRPTRRAVFFTWDYHDDPNRQKSYLDKCGGNIVPANSVEEADFVLAHGANVWQRERIEDFTQLEGFLQQGDLSSIEPILEQCKARNLPMVCANSDFIVRMPDGSTGYMPGNIAKRYEEMGGECKYFGKPDPKPFRACVEMLGLDASRVVHVGDSLHHDIAGANAAEIASVLVTSGIHCEELGTNFGKLPTDDALVDLLHKSGHTPTHIVSTFQL